MSGALGADATNRQILDLQILFNSVFGPFTPQPRRLHSAERRLGGGNDSFVDPDQPILKRLANTEDAADIAGVKICRRANSLLAGVLTSIVSASFLLYGVASGTARNPDRLAVVSTSTVINQVMFNRAGPAPASGFRPAVTGWRSGCRLAAPRATNSARSPDSKPGAGTA